MPAPEYLSLEQLLEQEVRSMLNLKLESMSLSGLFGNSSLAEQNIAGAVPFLVQYDRQLKEWLFRALELELEVFGGNKPAYRYLVPCLVIYAALATGGELQTSLRAAVGIDFLGKSSALFDDIQDQDKPDGIVQVVGVGVAMNLALMLLQFGEEQVGKALNEAIALRNQPFTGLPLPQQLLTSVAFAARGQLLDLQDNSHTLPQRLENPAYYIEKCRRKTGVLIGSWLEIGASLGTFCSTGRPQTEISEIYRQVGFNLGIVLQLVNDLKDFSSGLNRPENSRDLTKRNLTMPFIQAYHMLKPPAQIEMLHLWEEKSTLQTDTKLFELLTPTVLVAFTQTIGLAARYLVEAENYLKRLDPALSKFEHRSMLGMFEQIFRRFRGVSGQVSSIKLVVEDNPHAK